VQISGLGPIAPNCVLLGWPHHKHDVVQWGKEPDKAQAKCR
jgi:hypothetical protein